MINLKLNKSNYFGVFWLESGNLVTLLVIVELLFNGVLTNDWLPPIDAALVSGVCGDIDGFHLRFNKLLKKF